MSYCEGLNFLTPSIEAGQYHQNMHGQLKVKISFSWLAVTLFLRIFELLIIFSVGSQYVHIMLTSHLLVIEKHESRHVLCF